MATTQHDLSECHCGRRARVESARTIAGVTILTMRCECGESWQVRVSDPLDDEKPPIHHRPHVHSDYALVRKMRRILAANGDRGIILEQLMGAVRGARYRKMDALRKAGGVIHKQGRRWIVRPDQTTGR